MDNITKLYKTLRKRFIRYLVCQDADDDLIINVPFIVTPTILHHSQAKTINFDHEWS